MRIWVAAAAAALVLGACASEPEEVTSGSRHVVAALEDAKRPDADRERDSARHPEAMLVLAAIQPGQRVADLFPGGGYFTRLFAVAVGSRGQVYAVTPPPRDPAQPPRVVAVAADYGNVEVLQQEFSALALPESLDMVWTSQNYHDMHVERFNMSPEAVNRAVFAALKPGGLYIVIDHAAVDGSDLSTADSLHRIDQDTVRTEIEAAGFVYECESDAIRNMSDNRTISVFDESIRGSTDQFAMRFRKPANAS